HALDYRIAAVEDTGPAGKVHLGKDRDRRHRQDVAPGEEVGDDRHLGYIEGECAAHLAEDGDDAGARDTLRLETGDLHASVAQGSTGRIRFIYCEGEGTGPGHRHGSVSSFGGTRITSVLASRSWSVRRAGSTMRRKM